MRAIVVFLLSAWIAAAPASAQTIPENPHGSFRADCRICHDAESWTPATIGPEFDHARFGFPLEDAHRNVPCLLCHLTLQFDTATGTTCAGCHDDVHLGELGSDCERCHSTRNFVDRADEVRSHRATRFPLTGVHLTLDCAACHESGGATLRFVNTPVECEACHRDDYERTTDPDHVEASFPTDCAQCHSPYSWSSSAFNHALTGFPLTGAHAALDCRTCHGDGAYTAIDPACVACHLADYQATTNPGHLQSGFSTDCASCHGTSQWEGATFDHDALWFPIYSGRHRNEWTTCADCHGSPNDFSVFSCLGCHPHSDRAQTDEKHRQQSGYVYESSACYSCHPRGTH